MDRCFISELVYGPLHRGRSRLSLEDAFDLAEAVGRCFSKAKRPDQTMSALVFHP
ncbi:MAG: hypothetical protein ACJ786_14810 [Catenulispora sp.]